MYNINSNLFRAAQTQTWLLSSTLADNYSLATKLEWTFYYLIKSEFLYYNLSLINFTCLHHYQPSKQITTFKCFCTFFKQTEVMRKPRGWKNEYFKALSFKSTKKRLEKIPKFFFTWKTKDFAHTTFFQTRRKAFVSWADKYKRTYILIKLTKIAFYLYMNANTASCLRAKQVKPLVNSLRRLNTSNIVPKKGFKILSRCLQRLSALEERWYSTMKPVIPDVCRSSFHNIKVLQKKIFEAKLNKQFTTPTEIHFLNVFNRLATPLPFNPIERDWQLKRYKRNKLRVFKDLIFAFGIVSQKPALAWVLDLLANAMERNQKKQKQYIYFIKSLLSVLGKHGAGFSAYRFTFNGKIQGSRRTRIKVIKSGPLPLFTVDTMITYARSTALTKYGAQGIKVWLRY